MKKVRITLKQGQSSGQRIFLFPSAEALYVWACALERNEKLQVEGIEELVLETNGFIEAELRGFEYVYDDGMSLKNKRFDLVRLGKAHQPQNASGTEVSIHMGWVMGNMLPMKQYSDAHINVQVISAGDDRLDLAKLFNDDKVNDKIPRRLTR